MMAPPVKNAKQKGQVKLQGAQAIHHTFSTIEQTMAANAENVSLDMLRPLRQFRWCLTADEKVKVSEWVRIVANQAATAPSNKSLLGSADDHSLCIVSAATASTSASSAAAKEQRQLAKKAATQAQKLDTNREAILAFFKPKSGK